MTKNKPTLPPRKWYSLQQAADKLTREFNEPVTIEDLIHYWIHGYLMFSIKVEYSGLTFDIGDYRFSDITDKNNPDIFLESDAPFVNDEDFEIENIFFAQTLEQEKELSRKANEILMQLDEKLEVKKIGFNFDEEEKEISLENTINYTRNKIGKPAIKDDDIIRITGLLNIPCPINKVGFIDENKFKDGIELNTLRYLLSPKCDTKNRLIFVLSFNDEEFENKHLHINDFYILHSDFEDFISGKNYTDEINGKIEEIEKTKTSPRKQTNQAEFIKALLKLHYGIDEPEKARTLLGKNGELAKNFARASIEINITPETLRNWLNTAK